MKMTALFHLVFMYFAHVIGQNDVDIRHEMSSMNNISFSTFSPSQYRFLIKFVLTKFIFSEVEMKYLAFIIA